MKKHIVDLRIIISWIAAFIWMAVIFFFSAQPAVASDGLSKGFMLVIIKAVSWIYPLDVESSTTQDWIDQFNGAFRECAHAAAFFILALLVYNALRRTGFKGLKAFFTVLVFCALYAVSDEIHQIFVPGRACEMTDFVSDCFGILMGLILYNAISLAFNKRRLTNRIL